MTRKASEFKQTDALVEVGEELAVVAGPVCYRIQHAEGRVIVLQHNLHGSMHWKQVDESNYPIKEE